ncbi:MAG TPA: hypothetical protein IGS52_07785 [Oscillatoriaceae cyanobacterium M33_DOE_052]|uniref:Uncharacterized protein n=1 Tax=Planktothricoides sp. SpSt-374 TaxID=2282167 RepID=A0A7C3ZK87_9CYAN|nr:hypothetical protein [Oscillatoriaceae cyanobacterium M33_DOE_052]
MRSLPVGAAVGDGETGGRGDGETGRRGDGEPSIPQPLSPKQGERGVRWGESSPGASVKQIYRDR